MKSISLFFVFASLSILCLGQGKKSLSTAEKFYGIRNYEEALPHFLEAIEAGEKDPLVHYKTGECYLKMEGLAKQVKAIPYLEYALKNSDRIPTSVYYDLGSIYLRDENLKMAKETFTKYKELVNKTDKDGVNRADRALEQCNHALVLMSVPRNIKVTKMANTINSSYTEYNPVVSADESVLAFTALRPNTGKTRSGDKFIEEVYISYNESGNWSEPIRIPISSDYNVGTAGISSDGQKMMIFMGGVSDPGSIFSIERSGEAWSNPSVFAENINTPKYLESTASITPDGKVIYFASDRPGGEGGLDIYKIEKDEKGWSKPINLGKGINTKDNEDAPFIHPDQKTLFFTSDGHNSMGGKDIFKTSWVGGAWKQPENMGYPVNTTSDDNYFTLLADGTRGYFSSDRKGSNGGQDIYFIDMPEDSRNIPLTMVKGKILDAETGKPMPTRIYVIDNETEKKLDFVYDPDPKTGNYLVILPPSKNYDVIIESEGFLPYTLNINIPNQEYFYELYQQINLKTIKQFDVVVGQEVEVRNAFYDTNEEAKSDLRKTHEVQLVKTGGIDVYDMMLDLMAAGDQEGIDYLVGLINSTDPVDDINFNPEENSKIEVAKRIYYYDESDTSKFEQKHVEGKTIYSLPTFEVAKEVKRQQEKVSSNYDKTILGRTIKIFFDAGKSDLEGKYHQELDAILDQLKKHKELGVEISGFASQEGSEELNRELSNKRAISVLDYVNHRGIVRRRIVAKGFGATHDQSKSKVESRRVEVKVVDLNTLKQ